MISATEPQRKASTGVPQAMASIIDNPNGSGQSTGNSKALAPARLPHARQGLSTRATGVFSLTKSILPCRPAA